MCSEARHVGIRRLHDVPGKDGAVKTVPHDRFQGFGDIFRGCGRHAFPVIDFDALEAVMRHGFDGAVLSWNIMEVPDSHVSCLGTH